MYSNAELCIMIYFAYQQKHKSLTFLHGRFFGGGFASFGYDANYGSIFQLPCWPWLF